MRRTATGVLAATLAAVAAAGCGHTESGSRAAALQRGSAIYTRSCAGCHTLSGREGRAVGGDLVRAHLSVADLVSFALVMPARRPLSHADAVAVAQFVHAVAGR